MVPVQPPDAVQLVALVDDHVSLAVPPDVTDVGDALNVTAGAVVDAATVTVLGAVTEPPGPAQVSLYVVVAVNALVAALPDSDFDPDHPPDAVQLVALVDDHVSFEVLPDATDVGDADNVSVGADPTVTVSETTFEPPAPVHVSVNLVVAFNALVVALPDIAFDPDQPPEAVQLVALVDPQ